MLWIKRILKDQNGYGTVEMLFLIAGVSGMAFSVSRALLDALIPVHQTSVNNITGVSKGGY